MTQKQFDAALEKYGMKKLPFMGYVDIGGGRNVSVLNAGSRRRDQLAYLIQHQNKMLAEREREAKGEAI